MHESTRLYTNKVTCDLGGISDLIKMVLSLLSTLCIETMLRLLKILLSVSNTTILQNQVFDDVGRVKLNYEGSPGVEFLVAFSSEMALGMKLFFLDLMHL